MNPKLTVNCMLRAKNDDLRECYLTCLCFQFLVGHGQKSQSSFGLDFRCFHVAVSYRGEHFLHYSLVDISCQAKK